FCACKALISDARSMPRPASCFVENSTKICSSCAPKYFDFRDIRHLQQPGADVFDIIPQFTMREPVCRKTIDQSKSVAKVSGTSAALVDPLILTKIVVRPGLV